MKEFGLDELFNWFVNFEHKIWFEFQKTINFRCPNSLKLTLKKRESLLSSRIVRIYAINIMRPLKRLVFKVIVQIFFAFKQKHSCAFKH